jgi:stringent starvation protein B
MLKIICRYIFYRATVTMPDHKMHDVPSTKPYLIRAIHQWCVDCGLTPYITVAVNRHVRVPKAYVKNNQMTLNVSPDATGSLMLENDVIQFAARFDGVAQQIVVPVSQIMAIFARENSQGMAFPVSTSEEVDVPQKPGLSLVDEAGDDVTEGASTKKSASPSASARPKLTRIK